jgi:hypothetical protein
VANAGLDPDALDAPENRIAFVAIGRVWQQAEKRPAASTQALACFAQGTI